MNAALVARARQRIEAQVKGEVARLVGGVVEVEVAPAPVVAAQPAKKRCGWNPAARAAAKMRMVAFWAKREAKSK